MKHQPIDDHDVLNAFQDASPYQIATSAEKILAKAKTPKKRIPLALPLSFGGALLVAASVAAVFLLLPPSTPGEVPLSALSPKENAALGKEILSFHSFASFGKEGNQGFSLRRKGAQMGESDFLLGVQGYEGIQAGVRSLFDTPGYAMNDEDAGDYVYDGVSYDRKCEILDGSSSLVATYYYGLASQEGEERSYEGLYLEGDRVYSVAVRFEAEEDETEVSTLFVPKDGIDGIVHRIEKEEEFEGASSESSYTYARFSSFDEIEDGEPLSLLSYEFEDGILEASFEERGAEWEFANIQKTGESSFSFLLEEASGSEASDIPYALSYGEDGTRHYVSGTFETDRK